MDEKTLLEQLIEKAGMVVKNTKLDSPDHAKALVEYIKLNQIYNDRYKADLAVYGKELEQKTKMRELDLKEKQEDKRRELDEKKVDGDMDLRSKELDLKEKDISERARIEDNKSDVEEKAKMEEIAVEHRKIDVDWKKFGIQLGAACAWSLGIAYAERIIPVFGKLFNPWSRKVL